MTSEKKNELLRMISVMQAALEGEDTERMEIGINDGWEAVDNFSGTGRCYDYRTKSESEYLPFKNAEEVMMGIKAHGDWVRLSNNAIAKIVYIDNNTIKCGNNAGFVYNDTRTPINLRFIDGAPFGMYQRH